MATAPKDQPSSVPEKSRVEARIHPVLAHIPVDGFSISGFVDELPKNLEKRWVQLLGYGTGGIIFLDTERGDAIKIIGGSFSEEQAKRLISSVYPEDENASEVEVDPYYYINGDPLLNMLTLPGYVDRNEVVLRAALGSHLGSLKHPGVIDPFTSFLSEGGDLVGYRLPYIPGQAMHHDSLPEAHREIYYQIVEASFQDRDISLDQMDHTCNTIVTPDNRLKIIDVDADSLNPLLAEVVKYWSGLV